MVTGGVGFRDGGRFEGAEARFEAEILVEEGILASLEISSGNNAGAR